MGSLDRTDYYLLLCDCLAHRQIVCRGRGWSFSSKVPAAHAHTYTYTHKGAGTYTMTRLILSSILLISSIDTACKIELLNCICSVRLLANRGTGHHVIRDENGRVQSHINCSYPLHSQDIVYISCMSYTLQRSSVASEACFRQSSALPDTLSSAEPRPPIVCNKMPKTVSLFRFEQEEICVILVVLSHAPRPQIHTTYHRVPW